MSVFITTSHTRKIYYCKLVRSGFIEALGETYLGQFELLWVSSSRVGLRAPGMARRTASSTVVPRRSRRYTPLHQRQNRNHVLFLVCCLQQETKKAAQIGHIYDVYVHMCRETSWKVKAVKATVRLPVLKPLSGTIPSFFFF